MDYLPSQIDTCLVIPAPRFVLVSPIYLTFSSSDINYEHRGWDEGEFWWLGLMVVAVRHINDYSIRENSLLKSILKTHLIWPHLQPLHRLEMRCNMSRTGGGGGGVGCNFRKIERLKCILPGTEMPQIYLWVCTCVSRSTLLCAQWHVLLICYKREWNRSLMTVLHPMHTKAHLSV